MNKNNNTNTNNNINKTAEHCDTVTISKETLRKIKLNTTLLEAIASIWFPNKEECAKPDSNKVVYIKRAGTRLSDEIERAVEGGAGIRLFAKKRQDEHLGEKTPALNYITIINELVKFRYYSGEFDEIFEGL